MLIAARFERARLDGMQWGSVESVRILNDVSSELQLKQVGVATTLTSLTLEDEPELQALLNGDRPRGARLVNAEGHQHDGDADVRT